MSHRSSSSIASLVVALCLAALIVPGTLCADKPNGIAEAEESLRAAEIAFAQTMADRDHAAFASFLAPDAVFFGRVNVYRGQTAVAAAWKPLFDDPQAPFSWQPEAVAVLEAGDLGLSSGPIFDPAGKRVGTFNSVWRRDENGSWRVIFDRGCPPCSGS